MSITMSNHLANAKQLHNRLYTYEEYDGDKWINKGELALLDDTAFINNQALQNVHFHDPSNSLLYSTGKEKEHRSGRLYFTNDYNAFIGTLVGQNGKVKAVRGANHSVTYCTTRKPSVGGRYEKWKTLKIDNKWEEEDGSPILRTYYFLGDQDVTARTAVTKVDPKTWKTTIEMSPDANDPFGNSNDTFLIVVGFGGTAFTGTYTANDGTKYNWQGEAEKASLESNTPKAAVYKKTGPAAMVKTVSPSLFSADLRESEAAGPTLSVQDLNSITSIYRESQSNATVDVAQQQAGKYLNFGLVNGLDQKWIDQIYGDPYDLGGAAEVFNNNKGFFQQHSVLGTGQMVYDSFKTQDIFKDAIKKIKPDSLKAGWQALGKDKKYGEVSQKLYIEGYREAVPGIQPYLKNEPETWAKRYFDFLTSDYQLAIWQAQISSNKFDNIKQQMYEWYVKLSVLAPDKDYNQKMLAVAYSSFFKVAYNKVRWSDDIADILKEIIKNAVDGSFEFSSDLTEKAVKEYQDTLRNLIGIFDNIQTFGDQLIDLMTLWNNRNANRAISQAGPDIYEGIEELFDEGSSQRGVLNTIKEKGPKVLGLLFYGAAAGYLIYTIVENGKQGDLTPTQIIEEIGLGILTVGLLVKGVQQLLSLGVGEWLRVQGLRRVGFLADTATAISEWFSAEGKVVPAGRLGKIFVTIFGENYAEFFAKRFGPAMAVFGVVMSALNLARAIETGDTTNIIFESLNTFFALADLVFIGLELAGFAWAGPVGLAIAIVGLIVVLVQFIWNLVDPPKPKPSPIENFVTGPMKEAGFAT